MSKCARTVCNNTGRFPHKHIIKMQPEKAHYCLRCAIDINRECVRFGDEEVFDLSGGPHIGDNQSIEDFCDAYEQSNR